MEEVAALRRGDPSATRPELTVSELARRYLDQHDVDQLAAWRKPLSPGARQNVFQALPQCSSKAARWKWIDESPARHVKNPKPKAPRDSALRDVGRDRRDRRRALPRFAAIPDFAVGTGLRPEEWIALERRDVDRPAGVVTVERVYIAGPVEAVREDEPAEKACPVAPAGPGRPRRALATSQLPLHFPAARGGYIELNKWRTRVWTPALRAAGIPHRRIYDLRHTYATWSLATGVSLFTLSRRMGTSLAMIDATYGHLAPDAEEQERLRLGAYDAPTGFSQPCRKTDGTPVA